MRLPPLTRVTPGIATVLLVVSLAFPSTVHAEAKSTGGEAAGDFTLRSLDGGNISLSDFLGKNVILVNFWATWCAPCLKELPKLQELQDELGARGFTVISISVDEAKDEAKVKALVKRLRYKPTVLLDVDTRVVNTYNPRKDMPWTMIIGKDKLIHHKKKGFTDGDEKKLKEWIEGLL
tara:strand:+ start:186 stop:719 length:534 start_codon:yes stop_codon:yes gene_type:complete